MKAVVECVKCRERKEFAGATVIDCFGSALAAPGFKWSDVQTKAVVSVVRDLPKSEENLVNASFKLLASHVECAK